MIYWILSLTPLNFFNCKLAKKYNQHTSLSYNNIWLIFLAFIMLLDCLLDLVFRFLFFGLVLIILKPHFLGVHLKPSKWKYVVFLALCQKLKNPNTTPSRIQSHLSAKHIYLSDWHVLAKVCWLFGVNSSKMLKKVISI